MSLPFVSELDRSLPANVCFYLFTYLLCIFLSYQWLNRHLVHDFPNLFLIFSGVTGLIIVILLIKWRVWIPLKVIISISVSTFFVYFIISFLLKESATSHLQLSMWSIIKGVLAMPLVLTFSLKLHISITFTVIAYLCLKYFLSDLIQKIS